MTAPPNKPGGAMRYTPEQQEVLDIRHGPHIVCANAGTGKTESASELFVRLYLYEESKAFPHLKEGEHVGGKDQIRLLNNFFSVTFTVKAASELDDRIKKKFERLGVPLPVNPDNSPFTICRTLDSWLQKWFRKGMFFAAWEATSHAAAWRRTGTTMLSKFNASAQRLIFEKQTKQKGSQFFALMGLWDVMLVDPLKAMILDAIIALQENPDSAAPSWAGWSVEGWSRFLSEYTPAEGARRIGGEYWIPYLNAYKKAMDEMRLKAQRVEARAHKATQSPEELVEQSEVKEWERRVNKRDEFGTLYEIARSKNYVPGEVYDAFNREEFLEIVAMSENWKKLRAFDQVARAFHDFKRSFLLFDHGDFLYEVVATIQNRKHAHLMEPQKEYPSLIRRKYTLWDEVQDNSSYQGRVLRAFTPYVGVPYCKVIIGDFKQSIYLWRGANPFEFTRQVKDVKHRMPQNLKTLTISFRSAKKIVELGNSIVSTLPSYREIVNPSSTVHTEEGQIRCAQLFNTHEEEALWVAAEIKKLIELKAGTICVLTRTQPELHPLHKMLRDCGDKVSMLTMHRSKGLEADHVFILSCTAGKIPDVRGDYDQEVNLWYVACTRARKSLTLCSVIMERTENSEGVVEEKLVGPSPFFWSLPMLKEVATTAGWSDKMLQTGVKTTNQKLAQFIQTREEAMSALILEANEITNGHKMEKMERVYEEGTTAPKDPEFRISFESEGANSGKPQRTPEALAAEAKQTTKVIKKLKDGFFRNGGVPELDTESYQMAVSKGWIHREGGHWRVTDSFRQEHLRR